MTDALAVRSAIIGLLGGTAVEEQLLLAAAARDDAGPGSPARWAAAPLIAHNTEFKQQQVQRLEAIRLGQAPPTFAEIDHRSDEVYRRYPQQPADLVARASREVTAALIDGLGAIGDDDLLDPSRHPWLAGRQLWLQIIVRGFWHPMGHIGDYYIAHAAPARAASLQAHAVVVAEYLNAPDPARGMAYYNLACAQAQAGLRSQAPGTLRQAITLNADLMANVRRDADLADLRDSGQLDALLAS